MLVTSNRSLSHIAGPAPSPDSHHSPHHLPADLSPRSSNSSLISSNESLLNASPSVPSPGLRENGSSPRSGREDGISALQCLENALGRSPFTLFSESETDNDHLQQHINKTFEILGSPDGGTLACSPRLKSESGESHDEEMERSGRHLMPMVPSPIIKHQIIGTPNGSPTSSTGNGVLGSTIFQCPLCHVVYNSRHDFNEHIVTHSQQHACPKCTYITNIEDELHHHVQDVHGVEDYMEMFSDDEVVTPKTNAQGKLKTFKCKHCEYRAVTKKEFWDHTKSHIRQEKMLHCPKCPFVTEYKHHLEYHLRNHMGSKPYQCTKCSYSCVNKSMLNSHLKSHSNIYQYRCSDCSYATKYCHSLKLHLRKYNHSPAMVLNPDGTPNPLPIIDVYGTRRGPKMKRPDPILEGLATTQPLLPTSPQSNAFQTSLPKSQKGQRKTMSTPTKKEKAEKQRQRQLDGRDMSPKPASSPRFVSSMPNQPGTPPLKNNREDSSGDSDSDTRIPHHLAGRTQLPQAPISPSSIALILQRSNNNTLAESLHHKDIGTFSPSAVPNPLEIYNVAQYLLNPMLHMQGLNGLAQQLAKDQSTLLAHLLQQKNLPNQPMPQQEQTIDFSDRNRIIDASKRNPVVSTPLDLRNPKIEMPVFGGDESKKHKRKGKALRYERPSSSDNEEDDDDEALDFSNNNNNVHFKESKLRKMMADGPTDLSVSAGNLLCRFCEISFFDRELYTIHMNFHSGGEDPFLCRCGKKTQNKIEFFKHLTSDPH